MDENVLKELLDPSNDRAWKVAAGQMMASIHEQARNTNGRVGTLEKFMWTAGGAITALILLEVPRFLERY